MKLFTFTSSLLKQLKN